MAGDKKKNQHYVPQVYLKRFGDNQEKVNVFDKEKMEIRKNISISTIAAERYFYDVDLASFDKQLKEKGEISLSEQFPGYEKTDPHYIENLLDKEIESDYDDYIGTIIDRISSKSPWEIRNCYAISKEEKQIIALWAGVQIVRSKSFRDTIEKIQKAHAQFVEDLINKDKNQNDRIIVEAHTDRKSMQALHANFILNTGAIDSFTGILQSHSWIIAVNRSREPFATSDNPILTIPHKVDPFIQYSGYASSGVEVFFPLSPQIGIMMFEKDHGLEEKDRRGALLEDETIIREYNLETLRNAYRNLITSASDLTCYATYTRDHPEIRKNVISMMYNGKTYLFE